MRIFNQSGLRPVGRVLAGGGLLLMTFNSRLN
jgi:hypothetical protein